MRQIGLWVLTMGGVLAVGVRSADLPKAEPKTRKKPASEIEAVKAVSDARKEYQESLVELYDWYLDNGDKEKAKWVEEELRGFHIANKPAYRLEASTLPRFDLKPEKNIKEANELFVLAKTYKGAGSGPDYVLNQRRAEILFQQILTKYETSDKLADVAYELGEVYESKAFKQYDRSAAYYERACAWRKGTCNDSRLRAARLYDKQLNERTKAIEMYRHVVQHDSDPARLKEAEKRLAELTSTRK